jgi:two-component system, LytTR family, sensor histidine kinase AlgZ
MTECVAPRSSGLGSARRWVRLAALNTLAAIMVAGILSAGSRRRFLSELVSSLIFAYTIGGVAGVVMPAVARRLDWNRGRWAWLALTGALLTVAVVGCVAATFIIVGVGLVPAVELGDVLEKSLSICALVTLGFGGGMMVYEVTRARLEVTQNELRARDVERERAEKLLAETRLASLESRLHPHFLFNTLNAISALIPEDPERAEKLVEQLAALLRFSLDAGARHTVSLATEVEIVRAYLGIEEARLGDRLRYAIELPPELESCLVPPLALHTLVQNSVKHVAAARREPTEIRVRAEARGGRLQLGVWDDGPPFALETAPPGHGLEGLRARLAVLYGEEGTLDVAAADGGKVVSLSFPLRSDS